MPLPLRSPIPSLDDADEWLGDGPVARKALAGHPVLIHFWALGCLACEEQLPEVKRWHETFGPQGLKVIGVHTPLQIHGNTREEIEAAARAAGLTHPIALDHHGILATAFDVRLTPSYFVFDDTGHLRHYHAGYKAVAPVEQVLHRLIHGGAAHPAGA
ncbi:MAG: redoxin domain-containing protein [Myxococcaceae bacterium]|nr:redoxin domain-containing protein [Myxococcaceae bacterium]